LTAQLRYGRHGPARCAGIRCLAPRHGSVVGEPSKGIVARLFPILSRTATMRVRADAPTSASRPPFVSCRGRSGFASRADGQEPTREGVAAAPGDARQPTHPATPAVSDGGFGMTEADVNPALFTQEEIEQVVRRAVVR